MQSIMQLVERHKIQPTHRFWKQIDELCFLSKNLYNYSNYILRQSFIFDQVYFGYNQLLTINAMIESGELYNIFEEELLVDQTGIITID